MLKTRKFNDEVLYPAESPVVVDREFVEWMKRQSDGNPRRRIRLCAHQDPNDLIHEMLIVHAHMTYVRPHKHLTRIESFHVIEGEADLVMFDDAGGITRVISMGPFASGKKFYYRLTEPVFHTLLIYSPHLVFKEVTNGPFSAAGTVFAEWAPEDSQTAEVERFMRDLREKASAR